MSPPAPVVSTDTLDHVFPGPTWEGRVEGRTVGPLLGAMEGGLVGFWLGMPEGFCLGAGEIISDSRCSPSPSQNRNKHGKPAHLGGCESRTLGGDEARPFTGAASRVECRVAGGSLTRSSSRERSGTS